MQIGGVAVDLRDVDLTTREVRALVNRCAVLAAGLEPAAVEVEERAPLRFAAPILERLPDEMAPEPDRTDDGRRNRHRAA